MGRKSGVAWAVDFLGEAARLTGDYARAAAAYAEALQLFREIDNVPGQAAVLCNLGYVALHEHDYARARALFEEGLPLQRQYEITQGLLLTVVGLAGIAGANGKPQSAARLLGAVEASRQALGDFDPADRMEYDRILADVRAQLDEATFDAAWEEGRKMTLEEAVEYALKT
jgi:tetratricopeptide (TPR) repeat protein